MGLKEALEQSHERNSYYLGKKQVKRAKFIFGGLTFGFTAYLFLDGLTWDSIKIYSVISFLMAGLYLLGRKNIRKGLKELEREAIYMSIEDLNDME